MDIKIGNILKCKQTLKFDHRGIYLQPNVMYEIIYHCDMYVTFREVGNTYVDRMRDVSLCLSKKGYQDYKYVWDYFIDVKRSKSIVKDYLSSTH